MSVFSDDRAAIKAALDELPADITVYDHLPGRAIPPCALVIAGDPWVERRDGDPFGSATTTYEVWLVARTADNEVAVADLEEMAEAAADMLTAGKFTVEQIAQPFGAQLNAVQYLATTLTVTSDVSFR